MSAIDELELIYFPVAGRAKLIRLLFALGGIPFKDTRVTYPEYCALVAAGELPLETLPVLKIDGKIAASQSGAIARYAAKLAGLSLSGPTEVLRGEDFSSTVGDLHLCWSHWYKAPEESKSAAARELLESGLPFYAKRLETILSEGLHGGIFVADRITFPDVQAYCVLSLLVDVAKAALGSSEEDVLSPFPRLHALYKAVRDLPAVQQYQ